MPEREPLLQLSWRNPLQHLGAEPLSQIRVSV
jgi:hypothetical protein